MPDAQALAAALAAERHVAELEQQAARSRRIWR